MHPGNPDLGTHLGFRISATLRATLALAARAEGISDGAYARRALADALGAEARADRRSGIRMPVPETEAAARLLRDVTALVMAARELPAGSPVDGPVGALTAAHARLVRLIERAEA